ncbi:O-antigen ligase family protein [Nocardioides lijunqiniae]|uniref:O-antigen ligase family protein n=1 Tax=Nocardioides lijunqiniae TaxID=2760832 RepID=UPI001877735C|nr:O-antigen ligase family protein [Nocardioides lijunqiniae]
MGWQRVLEMVTGLLLLRRLRDAVVRWAEEHDVDGVDFLTLYVVVLFAIPASLVAAPLGAAGTPAGMLALVGACCWFLDRISRVDRPLARPHPVRTVGTLFVLGVLASYVAAMSRPITGTELNSIHTALIMLGGWAGLVVIAADGVTSHDRITLLVRRLVVGVGACATVGIVQFVTGQALTDRLSIPGLSVNTILPTVAPRDGFSRAIGTTINPIEFGVVMAAMLPLCVHVGLHGTGGLVRRWWPTLVVVLAVPFANSRSGFLALLAALLVIFPLWPAPVRLRACIVGAFGTVGLFLLVPGMLGTITSMFSGLSSDPTTTSRTGSYELGWAFIEHAPLFGRGFMTFLPPYRVIDNQYLGLLIDTGLVGTLALVATFLTGIGVALTVRRRTASPELRSLAAALAAGISGLTLSYAFFDALTFPTAAAVTALLLGLVDALWRIVSAERSPTPVPAPIPATRARDGAAGP